MDDGPQHGEPERRAPTAPKRDASDLAALARLTGGIAHDFNNLLAVIVGHLELLREQVAGLAAIRDGEALRSALAGRPLETSLDQMARAALRGADLVHHLLAIGRNQVLRPAPADVNRLLSGMAAVLHDALGRTVSLRMRLDPALPQVMIDRAQLHNAVLAVAANAHDAMPEGGEFVVETSRVELDAASAAADDIPAGRHVLLALRDTGQGMTAETLAHAFEPYFTTKEIGRSAGLGLAAVRGFMAQSGGGARLSSTPGMGTTVRLYLPVHDTATMPAAAVPAGAAAAPATAMPTVLLVDDDPAVRELVRIMLERLGCRVRAAADGAEALALLRAEPGIDLLLTDVVLPGGPSGPEIADQAMRDRPGLEVLYMSGYPATAARLDQRLQPGENLLAKPFRKADLARLLQRRLGHLPRQA